MNELNAEDMSIYDINSEWYGVSRRFLMENAGAAIASEIHKRLGSTKASIAIFCGTGGNGGDGMVIARHLYNTYNVIVYLLGSPDRISSKSARMNWETLQKLPNLRIEQLRDSSYFNKIIWEQFDLYIDALLGSGLKHSPRNPHAKLILKMNSMKSKSRPIWSVDMPSGLLDSGKPGNPIVAADLTFVLHAPKLGSISLGETVILPIGIPKDAIISTGPGYLKFFGPHSKNSHKGQNGVILAIVGSKSYHGAAIISVLAALKTTVDLVYIYTSSKISNVIRSASPEVIVSSYNAPYLTLDQLSEILSLAKSKDAILLGPGIGRDSKTTQLVQQFILEWMKMDPRPSLVIDADALTMLDSVLEKLPSDVILTPHAGEFYALTKTNLESTENLPTRISQLLSVSNKMPVTWLVKGPIDLIAFKDIVIQNYTHTPSMTIGGTGDALAGLCAGFLARSHNPFYSAIAATFLLGDAGEYVDQLSEGFSTEALVKAIPYVMNQLTKFIHEEPNI